MKASALIPIIGLGSVLIGLLIRDTHGWAAMEQLVETLSSGMESVLRWLRGMFRGQSN